jgi:hypothetical protein
MGATPTTRRTVRLRTLMLLMAVVALGVTVVVQSIKVARLEARLADREREVRRSLYREQVSKLYELDLANQMLLNRTRSPNPATPVDSPDPQR